MGMKIESILNNMDINTLNMPDLLGKLEAGDIIRAKVLEVTANQLTLKLFDGTVFNAKLLTSMEAEVGDISDFIVKSNENGLIVLETLREIDDSQRIIKDENSDIKKQLFGLGIKPDKDNVEIAKAIKQYALPLDKDIFSKIADTIATIKNVTPQKVAYLVANKIPPEKDNLALLNRIVDDRQKVGSMLKSTFDALSKLDDKDTIEALSRILDENLEIEMPYSGKNLMESNQQQKEVSQVIKESLSSFDVQDKNLMYEFKGKLQEFLGDLFKTSSQEGIKMLSDEDIFTDKVMSYLKDNIRSFENLDMYEMKSIDNTVKDLFERLKVKITDDIVGIEGEDSLKQSIESSGYKKLLKDVFEKLYVKIDEKATAEDFKVKKLYKDLYKTLEIIKNAVEHSTSLQKDDILNKINNLQSNLKFINDINNHSLYIPIPINIQGTNTTGELYVLKNGKRGKKIDPQNTSVLISLNTPNLGQIDSLITVNKKNISINIRVEEQPIIKLIKENYIQLYNSLLEKGYKLVDVKCRLLEEEVNVINAEHTMQKELDLNKQKKIDYKI